VRVRVRVVVFIPILQFLFSGGVIMSAFYEKNGLVKSFLLLCIINLSARAAITPVGDISPTDPASWNIATDGYVGKTADGSLVINGGSVLSSDDSYLGYNNNVTGSVTVDGTGSSWTNDSMQYIGYSGNGTLTITGGGQVDTWQGYLGANAGSTGTAIVSGDGSKWTSSGLDIGCTGTGILNVEAGGQIHTTISRIGQMVGSSGTVTVSGTGSQWINEGHFEISQNGALLIKEGGQVSCPECDINNNSSVTVTGIGSKWNLTGNSWLKLEKSGNNSLTVADGGEVLVSSIFAPLGSLMGNGVISSNSAVLDGDFNMTASQTNISFGTGGTLKITLSTTSYLGAGYQSVGVMRIVDGTTVVDQRGFLGYDPGSDGTAIVSGPGSKWNNTSRLDIGYSGNGTLKIENGGYVKCLSNTLGYNANSHGIATVSGAGSTWSASSINVGSSGSGELNIIGGGTVIAFYLPINEQSLLAIDVGTGSNLAFFSSPPPPQPQVNNNGTIRILAGASPLASAVFTPISATIWGGTGTYQPVGGTWNSTTHEFTVSGVQNGDSGVPVTIDRSTTQRTLIGDAASTWKLGASFAATDAPAALTFTATAIGDGPLDSLKSLLSGDPLLGGWNLAADAGYTVGDPIYLSFKNGIGGEYTYQAMQVWSYDGTTWSKYATDDLTYDGTYASFTTTAPGCYAVSVPEPGSITLLILGFGGLLIGYGRKK
jgi:T5SS/PEP-CTERM-associated repeat protein